MAGFTGVLSGISMVSNLIGGMTGLSDDAHYDEAAYKATQARQQAEYQNALQKAAMERAKIEQDAEAAEATRQAALKRAIARQRALFGASGIASGDSGSSQALLLGLAEESEEERQHREALDTLRYQALDSDLAHRRRVNVLELGALRDKQNIGKATAYADVIGSSANILA